MSLALAMITVSRTQYLKQTLCNDQGQREDVTATLAYHRTVVSLLSSYLEACCLGTWCCGLLCHGEANRNRARS